MWRGVAWRGVVWCGAAKRSDQQVQNKQVKLFSQFFGSRFDSVQYRSICFDIDSVISVDARNAQMTQWSTC